MSGLSTSDDSSAVMRYSVIIPCYNCADLLPFQLDALRAQDFDQSWEVIVADNGSDDDPAAVVAAFASRGLDVKYVRAAEVQGAAHARNRGCEAASGEAFLFCDGDDEVGAGWLQAMHRALQEHELVTGPIEYQKLNERPAAPPQLATEARVWDWLPFLPHGFGGNMAITRSLHEAIGGYDEELLAAEDIDYSWRAQLTGVPLYFARDAVIHYRLRSSAGAVFSQMVRNGENSVKLYKKFRNDGADTKTLKEGLRGWWALVRQWRQLLSVETRARWMRRLGMAAGRLKGSLKHRIVAI